MEKVWIYLSDKEIKDTVKADILREGRAFISNWHAHNNPLAASFDIVDDRFMIIKVDGTQFTASGCSIDKLMQLIKRFEADFQLQLLNRLLVAYQTTEGTVVTHASKIKELLSSRRINPDTLFYNVSASDGIEFENWLQPLKETWLKKYI